MKFKYYFHDSINKLKQSGFWDTIPYNFKMTLLGTLKYNETIEHDLDIIKKAIKYGNITKREVELLRKIGIHADKYNVEYGETFKEERDWKKYGEPDYKIAEKMYQDGRELFITLLDASNAASRLKDYINPSPLTSSNSITIGNNAQSVQVQQNTLNSFQSHENDEFNYEKAIKIVNEIKKHSQSPLFEETFNENSEIVKQLIDQVLDQIEKKRTPFKNYERFTNYQGVCFRRK